MLKTQYSVTIYNCNKYTCPFENEFWFRVKTGKLDNVGHMETAVNKTVLYIIIISTHVDLKMSFGSVLKQVNGTM